MTWLGRLRASERGSIMVMGAMALVAAIGMSGLAVEVGNAYSVKVQHQRVADVAALAAALAYRTAPTAGTLDAAAKDVALANGLARATTTAVLSPDKSKVTVTVQGTVPLVLTRVLGSGVSLSIRNEAVASLVAADTGGGACFLALKGSVANGIAQSGGVTIDATDCGVATNAGIALESSSTVIQNASEVLIGKSLSGQKSWIRNTKPENIQDGRGTPAADPFANDAKLQQAFAALGTFTQPATPAAPPALTAPVPPNVPTGTDWNLSGTTGLPAGVSVSGGNYVVAANGTYRIRSLNIGEWRKLIFLGSSTVTISNGIGSVGPGIDFGRCTCRINGAVNDNGQSIILGDGDYQFGGPVTLGSNSAIGNGPIAMAGTFTINSNNFTIGSGAHRFNHVTQSYGIVTVGAGDFSVAGTLTIGGTLNVDNGAYGFGAIAMSYGTLNLGVGDVTVPGQLSLGNGTFKSLGGNVWIGRAASDGVGLKLAGGAKLYLGNGNLTVAGGVDVTGGGTTLQMGTGSIVVGRASNGIGFNGTNGTITTGGGTYLSVLGRMTIAGDGTVASFGPADVRIGNDGSNACTSAPATCDALTFTGNALAFGAGPFSVNGRFVMDKNGTLTLGAGAHLINGTMQFTGAATFGAGTYMINGDLVRPNTSSGTVSGSGVSIILKGLLANDGGSSFALTAPTDGDLKTILLATRASGQMRIANGNHALGGVVYAPNADLRFENTNIRVSSAANSCLTWIVGTAWQGTGGYLDARKCTGGSGTTGSSGSIALLQ
jgi:hypothetical protein